MDERLGSNESIPQYLSRYMEPNTYLIGIERLQQIINGNYSDSNAVFLVIYYTDADTNSPMNSMRFKAVRDDPDFLEINNTLKDEELYKYINGTDHNIWVTDTRIKTLTPDSLRNIINLLKDKKKTNWNKRNRAVGSCS